MEAAATLRVCENVPADLVLHCHHAAAADTEKQLGAGAAVQAIDACAGALAARFDARHGGFGGAPKFPRTSELNLLLVKALRDRARGGSTPGALLQCMHYAC